MTQIDRMTMEEKFFSTRYFFSYSGLNKLLFSPRLWYKHYILQEREERTDAHLVEGKVIHSLLLDEDNFNKNFMILPGSIPTANTKIVVDKVFSTASDGSSLSDNQDVILVTLQEMNLHQKLKTDEQRIAKIVSEDTESYWDFLKNKEGKDIIDQAMLDRCKENANLLKQDAVIADLLKVDNKNEKISVYNEEAIKRNGFADLPFGIKGIVDNIVIDNEEKVIYVNDLKTTGKTVEEFPETVEYYNYWLQAALYKKMTQDLAPEDYNFIFTFIVIDKYQQVYPFRVTSETMSNWRERTDEVLEKAKWHFENRKFNLPYKFEKETVTL